MIWIIAWKYKHWIAIAVLSFICFGQLAYTNHLVGQLNKADAEKDKAVAAAIKPYKTSLDKQQSELNKASADYEKLKSEQRVKNEVVIKEVQKIIDRPVYRNVCIDSDGMYKLNSLITNTS